MPEIKQISALLILVTGIAIQELKVISQKAQELAFQTGLKKTYDDLCKDNIVGKRVTALPFKFLNIGTSRAKECLSGIKLRKKYSAMKSYMNNTLSPLYRK
jgi:hypothetical protein